MTLILIPTKLVDISKNTDLSRNFCYLTLLKSHFCIEISCKFAAFLRNTFSEEHLRMAASGHLH